MPKKPNTIRRQLVVRAERTATGSVVRAAGDVLMEATFIDEAFLRSFERHHKIRRMADTPEHRDHQAALAWQDPAAPLPAVDQAPPQVIAPADAK